VSQFSQDPELKTTNGAPTDRPMRAWQRRALPKVLAHREQAFLLEACPGAGKTLPGLRTAKQRLDAGEIERLVVVCPTKNLARQWAREATAVGISLEPNWTSSALPRDCDGVAVTYQRVAACPELYRHAARMPTMVIADEPHHMGESAAWGQAFEIAFEPARYWLLLFGTAFRSDNQPIPGVRYSADGLAQPDFIYGYAEAVRDGVCRKIAFVPFDGELKWSDGGTIIEATFEDELDGRQAAYRLRTLLSPGMVDGLTRIVAEADAQLSWVREQGHTNAGGLIVACDIMHAHRIADIVGRITGQQAVVIVSDDPQATTRLERFRNSDQRWVIAVKMVSEGVDIPRLRVGVYATTAKTPLLFRQIIGRFVRVQKDLGNDPSYLFLPADSTLRALADEIEDELRHQLSSVEDPTPEPESHEQQESAGMFVPLDARVQAQGALMGGLRFSNPAQATAIYALARDLGEDPDEIYRRVIGDTAPVLPSLPSETEFERRERLRKERKRLVGHLHHRSGRDYAEINTWINDAVACGKPVSEHTISELEKSIRALTQEVARCQGCSDSRDAAA
jgi:superfamily II DNA or RNA helicase